MPSLGFPELIIILVIALIVFGPGKLPTVGGAIGKALNEFKKASRELTKDDEVINASEEDKDKDKDKYAK
jgi:sec-independent protein translocase protein TatA